MDEPRSDFKSVLAAELEHGRRAGSHLDPEAIEAFHAHELESVERERVADHLAACSDCLALLRELDAFNPLDGPSPVTVPPGEAERSLDEFQRRTAMSPPMATELGARSFFPAWSAARGPYALAATLLLALLGGLLWIGGPDRRWQALPPQANSQIVELRAQGLRGRDDPEVPTVSARAGEELFHFILYDSETHLFDAYEVVLSGPGGERLATVRGLERTPYHSFTLTFSRSALPTGESVLQLYGRSGRSGSARTRLAAYRFRLVEE